MTGPFRFHCAVFPVILCLLLCSGIASAQERGSVSGTVTDSSGAGVPGVSVVVTDTRTNVTRAVVTNSAGLYTVSDLIPDPYRVAAEVKGFKRAERSVFTLDVAQAARVDLQLQIGDVSESVSVQAAPPLLATNDATVGQVIGPVMMSQLPLNDRNYLQLALLSPGTGTYGKSSFYNSALTDNAGSVISGSAGEDRNAFSLDGGPAQADDLLRRLQLVVHAHPAHQVGHVGTRGGQEPAASVLTAQSRPREQGPDQRVPIAHRPQQQLRGRRRFFRISPQFVCSQRVDEEGNARGKSDGARKKAEPVDGHGVQA